MFCCCGVSRPGSSGVREGDALDQRKKAPTLQVAGVHEFSPGLQKGLEDGGAGADGHVEGLRAAAMRGPAARDEHNLQRFVDAQKPVYKTVLRELKNQNKTTHWVWWIFPQLPGLGRSDNTKLYALKSIEEARAYFAHPVLGPRLVECCRLLLNGKDKGKGIEAILGPIDAKKFQSCCTLFRAAAPQEPVFQKCLDRFYGGDVDERTVAQLSGE